MFIVKNCRQSHCRVHRQMHCQTRLENRKHTGMKERQIAAQLTVDFDVNMTGMANFGKIAWKVERVRVWHTWPASSGHSDCLGFTRYFAEICCHFCDFDVKICRQQCCCLFLFHSRAISLLSSRPCRCMRRCINGTVHCQIALLTIFGCLKTLPIISQFSDKASIRVNCRFGCVRPLNDGAEGDVNCAVGPRIFHKVL